MNDIYDWLLSGVTPVLDDSFREPSAGPASSSRTTTEIYSDFQALLDQCDAGPDDVVDGAIFFNPDPADWGPAGGGRAPAPTAGTGQTSCWNSTGNPAPCAGTGQDGDLRKGETVSPRFTDNGDGTVTDNLTGLIWLKSAACFGTSQWADALIDANSLASGSCGLSDDSAAGDWRLPNVHELQSLADYEESNPALPTGHPFTGVQSNYYWLSTTVADDPGAAWRLYMWKGLLGADNKNNSHYVWPVRDPQ